MATPITALTYFPRPDLKATVATVVKSGLKSAITLFAPRRKGKTLFVHNEVMPWAQSDAWHPVYIDLWADREQPEEALIRGLVKATRKSWIARKLENVKLKGKTPIGELEAEFDKKHADGDVKRKAELRLADAIDALVKQSSPVFLVLDEFQALAGTQREPFVAAFRSCLLKHGKKIFAFYTGSSEEQLIEMFRTQRAPLFDSAYAMELPDLGDDFVANRIEFVRERTRTRPDRKAMIEVFDRVNRSPEALNDIALRLIINNNNDVEGAYQAWRNAVAINRQPRVWDELNLVERRILQSIAKGKKRGFMSQEALAKLGEGTTLNTVNVAVRRLKRLDLIYATGHRGELEIADPYVIEFLRQLPQL